MDRPVYDWKKAARELEALIEAEAKRHGEAMEVIESKAKEMIELGGKDAEEWWKEKSKEGTDIWMRFKKWCNWDKYWAWYCGAALIICGLLLHYIIGL